MARRVAVIGAGVSGLSSIKCCLDEGLEPICFERSNNFGGLWKFTESSEDGMNRIYRSLVTNTCKEMSCYSDFPFQEDYPNFMNQEKFWNYLQEFAEHFDLLKYIRFRVLLSTRTGAWVLCRSSDGGYPFNMVITRRCVNFIAQVLPSCVLNRIQERQLNKRFNHENYGLSITKGKKSKFVVNDELPTCILCGTITMKTSVKEFTETSALFEDGTVGENIDIVIFATGYTFSFPFFEEPFKSLCTKKIFLYKRVFPSNLERATLAVIGFIGLKGSILAATELQARWATRVFKGLCQIPPSQKLMAEATKKEQLIKRGVMKDTSEDKLEFILYLDDIAACIGAKPSVPSLFLKDPRLAWEVFFGPCTPYQYRLVGPGKWDGARNAILTQWDRTLKPLKTRTVPNSTKPASMSHYLKVWGAPILLASLLLICKSSLFLKSVRDNLQNRISPYLISIW
ncbi:dimethylaniline monooxygenase [N-oxide-forming] 4 isoform X4 [Ursus americanus]|uniref:dimethylaniline monooxygenase [N-oxide-forming] 4 isoform X4 n=1 Tax=Ursus americanus TaxID=9643 RepID=UPI001E67DEDB|nr:dimethylaniline monooxygenase [N-oxide-forming] 4 isoform X4 [Ursus americanus]